MVVVSADAAAVRIAVASQRSASAAMKEIYGGILIAAALVAVVGIGTGGRSPVSGGGRASLWNELRHRDPGPEVYDARFSSPMAMPISTRSPKELAEPVIAFAGEITDRAADISRRMSPEMGLPALVTTAAAAFAGDAGAPAPRPEPERTIGVPRDFLAAIDPFGETAARGAPGAAQDPSRPAEDAAAQSAEFPDRAKSAAVPFPIPRPSTAERAALAGGEAAKPRTGVIAAALGILRAAGLSALEPPAVAETQPRRLALLPDESEAPVDPAGLSYSDRAALPGLNPGPPRDPFTDLRNVYRDRAPGDPPPTRRAG